MEFQRDIYKALVKWAEGSKGLLLKGTRQVGKTFILNKLAHDKFKKALYINLGARSNSEWFEAKELRLINGSDWADAFSKYAKYSGQEFSNDKETIVILDEIQSSNRVFNGLRQMVREGSFRVVATGSYLGIMDIENAFAANKQAFFYPAGDVELLEMYTMTYLEVINACNQQGITNLDEICDYYLRFGGFPEVVRNWILNRKPDDCINTLKNIFGILVAESQKYFHGAFPKEVWIDTLLSVIKQIESKKAIPESEELVYKFREAPGLDVKKAETVDSMRWMLSCNLLFFGNVTNNLKHPEKSVKYSYYLIDQGLMYIILYMETQNMFTVIERGNIPGLLAENFVALNIREFTRPVTYDKHNPPEEIDFISTKNGSLTAIEVKFSQGEIKSSEAAFSCGDIKHIIKIQGIEEPSTEDITVLPLRDCHKLGELLGKPFGITKYDSASLEF